MDHIRIQGARTHNLKNINLDLPRDKIIVLTGVSGSGKSSLAFDTIYAEGQRRYVESLSSYARQFLSMMDKPDVDHIEGLSPAISIEQKSTSHNPRSTVGTVTEIYDYLRLLFARSGTAYCPRHQTPLQGQTVSQMVDTLMGYQGKVFLLAPLVQDKKGQHAQLFEKHQAQGFSKVRINGEVYDLGQTPELSAKQKHTIELVVDRIHLKSTQTNEQGSREGVGEEEAQHLQQRLTQSLETALKIADTVRLVAMDEHTSLKEPLLLSSKHACSQCSWTISEIEPRLFSFNAPSGACPECDGLGVSNFFDVQRIVRNPDLSLTQGAITGWGKSNPGYHARIESVGKHYGFDMHTPWKDLKPEWREILLQGSKDIIKIKYMGGYSHRRSFEGVLGNLQRRWAETKTPEDQQDLLPYMSTQPCKACGGSRLNEQARHVYIQQHSLPDLTEMSIDHLATFFEQLQLDGWKGEVAEKIVKEIKERLMFLQNVGLNYLSLSRRADTLSGGEAQRIRLASQIGAGLVGVMYVLDEPSIGLHQRDNDRLLSTLTRLRDLGNTVIVVEHDEDAIRLADHVVDIGPRAGVHGGEVVASGTLKEIIENPHSLTGQYLSGKKAISIPERKKVSKAHLSIQGATGNNLKNVSVDIPLGVMTCVTGVSGSGKSTLINDTLLAKAEMVLNGASTLPAPHKDVKGLEQLDKVVNIDQSPIGRTPRSNPATYTGLFTPLRELFAQLPEARSRGYTPGRFSFNVSGGRCEACSGDGVLKVEMHFLPDVYVLCDVCKGKRYNNATLEVHYKGHSIHDVLDMTVEKAMEVFDAVPALVKKLKTLDQVGLGYIKLGQSSTTLSGGEAQRVKLSKELSKKSTGQTLYVLDEPTTGLHFEDIRHLLDILHHLKDEGNTVVVIEHNLDVIKTADWVIDLGPEGGDGGGTILTEGTPEMVAKDATSYTGQFLNTILSSSLPQPNPAKNSTTKNKLKTPKKTTTKNTKPKAPKTQKARSKTKAES